SGLMIFDNHFWGFNDSGGENKLYGFNKSGKIKYVIELDNAKNSDWESMTQDSNRIFIGDFGNNSGARKDLCVYMFNKKDRSENEEQEVDATKIEFKYAGQDQFNFADKTTPYDCEAMVAFKNRLYIFSKNWRDGTTWQYELPIKRGEYEITPTDTFDVKALVTGADISPDNKTLALLGYENYQSFIWLFSDFEDDRFFEGLNQTIILEGIDGAQTEGICFLSNDSILVSCEKTRTHYQQVFLFDLNKLRNGTH
ncbi:MAG TPA: hypothetical protein VEP89_13190, partial [Draconibacterium sp.]|nr:hypothetical protein [Draconibacterium sp.]